METKCLRCGAEAAWIQGKPPAGESGQVELLEAELAALSEENERLRKDLRSLANQVASLMPLPEPMYDVFDSSEDYVSDAQLTGVADDEDDLKSAEQIIAWYRAISAAEREANEILLNLNSKEPRHAQ